MTSKNQGLTDLQKIGAYKKLLLHVQDQRVKARTYCDQLIAVYVAQDHLGSRSTEVLVKLAKISEEGEKFARGARLVYYMYAKLDWDDCQLFLELNPEIAIMLRARGFADLE